MGRLVADAQVKTTTNGDTYIDMRMVVNMYKGKDKDSEPFWVSVRSFNTPKSMAKYYTKGKPLIVEGSYENKIYKTNDGRASIDNSILAYRKSRLRPQRPLHNPNHKRLQQPIRTTTTCRSNLF